MLAAFTASLLLITISELGDKTFFIAVILAMRHSQRLVFAGVTAALATMTVLSVLVGQAVSILPQVYVDWGEILLFFGFGVKLLLEARQMPNAPNTEEEQDALEAVEGAGVKPSIWGVLVKAFVLTFVAEWGDRTQIATIALAAANHPVGVIIGGTLGHSICAAIAVLGGRAIAGRISERTITILGGSLFIIFGAVAFWEKFGH
ncbi:MAG: TMEM165/GDT1 family protein [Oscillatoriaceae cyanobacterium]